MKAMGRRLFSIILLFFMSLAPTAHAQALTGSIYGRLWGPTNTPVVEGYVIVTDETIETLLGEAVTTRYPGNKAGHYSIVGLPANKKLTVFAFHEKVPGFLTQKKVTLKPGENLKVILEIGLGGWQDPGMISNPLLRLPILLKQAQNTKQANELIKRLEELAKEPGKASVPPGLTNIGTNEKRFKEYRNEKDGSILIEIPAGEFTMGSNVGESDEKPMHQVYLDRYYIGEYEVTVGQFRKFCTASGRTMPDQPSWNSGDNYPVVNVSWNDAKAYCDWAGLRLPTEAEWEKAARGTDGRKRPWGDQWDSGKCNSGGSISTDGYEKTSPVGSFPKGASPFGALDMVGNVWEWCADWYDNEYYSRSANNNPTGPSSGVSYSNGTTPRVLRGGSWNDPLSDCRSARRNHYDLRGMTNQWGFRIAQ